MLKRQQARREIVRMRLLIGLLIIFIGLGGLVLGASFTELPLKFGQFVWWVVMPMVVVVFGWIFTYFPLQTYVLRGEKQ